METTRHDLSHLFRQLGMSGDPQDIDAFISGHRLQPGVSLWQAPFWSLVQATFLSAAIADDSDWAEAVDELAARLS
jgi:hypothetical protein